MPPPEKPPLSPEKRGFLLQWIETAVFRLDPANPDPGRVTVRLLNREEYRNTIRDLLGVEYNTQEQFPADDTRYGFDTIRDVLSISPLLTEKHLEAAKTIVDSLDFAGRIPTVTLPGTQILGPSKSGNARWLPFTKEHRTTAEHRVERAGRYLSRRHFLRGLGISLGLPFLESAAPLTQAFAGALPKPGFTPEGRPLRMAFLYVPNGVNVARWKSAGIGEDYLLSPTLEPLALFRKARKSSARRPTQNERARPGSRPHSRITSGSWRTCLCWRSRPTAQGSPPFSWGTKAPTAISRRLGSPKGTTTSPATRTSRNCWEKSPGSTSFTPSNWPISSSACATPARGPAIYSKTP